MQVGMKVLLYKYSSDKKKQKSELVKEGKFIQFSNMNLGINGTSAAILYKYDEKEDGSFSVGEWSLENVTFILPNLNNAK